MKKIIFLNLLLLIALNVIGQGKYSTFYNQRATLFEQLPITSKDIIFLGNSITNGGEWSELFGNKNIKNRGISGDIAQGVYDRLNAIVKGKPKKIFLLIGINDISRGTPTSEISNNIEKIVKKIHEESPKTKIYLQSVLPVNPDLGMFQSHMKPDSIVNLNSKLKTLAKENKIKFIDLYPSFILENTNKLNPEYTNDGLHLLGKGYMHWRNVISSYVKE